MRSFVSVWILLFVCWNGLYGGVARFDSARFRKADSVAALYYDHSLKDLQSLSRKLTESLPTEAEKFRAIYKWVCDNIDNDYDLNVKNQQKREQIKDRAELAAWNRKAHAQTFRNLVENRKTVCSGYAWLVRELAHHAGLACQVIDGYGRNARANVGGAGIPNHTWNAIRLDGQWYLCDPTWSSGAWDAAQSVFIRNFNEAYFLSSPALFNRNHYPLDTTWTLLRQKPLLSEFLNAPLIYADAFAYGIEPVLPATFEMQLRKGEEAIFQFVKGHGKIMENIRLQVEGVKTQDVARREVSGDGVVRYTIGHTFNRRLLIEYGMFTGLHYFGGYRGSHIVFPFSLLALGL